MQNLKTIQTNVITRPVKVIGGAINSALIFSISGAWAGTQTNNGYIPNIGFELTDNGEYLIKDNNGLLAAKGTYTFSNNSINGTYKLLSSGETYSFTGTFDPVTQKLNCTLGISPSTTGQGIWVVTKK